MYISGIGEERKEKKNILTMEKDNLRFNLQFHINKTNGS